MSIPGVVEFSETILIPEIGNFKDFSTEINFFLDWTYTFGLKNRSTKSLHV